MLRLGLVGPGAIARRHVAALDGVGCARLVAVAGPIEECRSLAGGREIACYASTSEMLATEGVGGVIITTPTPDHCQPALQALDAGAHVLVEKPITASLAEAESLITAAERAGRHVLVGHHRRYYHVVEQTRKWICEGRLGRLLAVSGHWNTLKPNEYFAPCWRRAKPSGPVMTNLIHEIDLLRHICGEITSITAFSSNDVRRYDKEDTAALALRFAEGALGTFILSDSTPSPWTWEAATGENPAFPHSGQNVLRFMGSEACLEFPNLRIWSHRSGQAGWNHPIYPETIVLALNDAFSAQMHHFCAVIRGEAEPKISARDGMASLAAVLRVLSPEGYPYALT